MGVDDELLAMKKRLAEGASAAGQRQLAQQTQTPLRRVKDEIDWEIEAIKAKVFVE